LIKLTASWVFQGSADVVRVDGESAVRSIGLHYRISALLCSASFCCGQEIPAPSGAGTPGVFLAGEQFAQLLEQSEVVKDVGVPSNLPLSKLKQELRDGDLAALRDAGRNKEPVFSWSLRKAQSRVTETIGGQSWLRLRQLHLRAVGLTASVQREQDLRRELNITEQQRTEIAHSVAASRPASPQAAGAGDAGFRGYLAKVRDAQDEKTLAALTPEQRTLWRGLIGVEPKYSIMPPAPPSFAAALNRQLLPLPLILPGARFAKALRDEAVQSELKLTAGEKEKIPAVIERLIGDDERTRKETPDAPLTEISKLLQRRQHAVFETVSNHLSKSASERLRQLMIQSLGLLPALRSDPETSALLDLAPEQHRKLAELVRDGELPLPPLPAQDTATTKRNLMEFRKRVDAIVLERVLNAEQRRKWEGLVGAPSNVELAVVPLPAAPPALNRAP
jgi:hypothetical protein